MIKVDVWKFLDNIDIGLLYYGKNEKMTFNEKARQIFNINNKRYISLNELDRKLDLKIFNENSLKKLQRGEKINFLVSYNKQELFLSIVPYILSNTDIDIYILVIPIREVSDFRKKNLDCDKKNEESRNEIENLFIKNINPNDYIFYSNKIKKIINDCLKVSKIDSTVLITGESGVGKEVVAKIIHQASERAHGAMISINCASIPENLLEAELFGYEKGAFTGALNNGKPGLFEIAHGGTLFLDEIGDMPSRLQAKLLRVIQDKEIYRIGSISPKRVDVRIIAATNRDLKKMISYGAFREDLYYRLNVIAINIPPLRERKEDIKPLIGFFLNKYNNKFNSNIKIAEDALSFLENYYWPGNVRELENLIQRVVIFSENEIVDKSYLMDNFMDNADYRMDNNNELENISNYNLFQSMSLQEAIEKIEREILITVKNKCKTTKEMAEVLKVSQPTIVRKLKKYNL